MTPLELQSALKKRVEKAVIDLLLNSSEGVQKTIQVFEQHLPTKAKSSTRNPESTLYPCVIVYLDGGDRQDFGAPHQAKFFLVIGVYDEESNNQGYRDAISIAQKIIQSLERQPMIEGRFELQYPLNWKYSDEENGPYHFAWIEANFELPHSKREDVEGYI
ncbi:hypothetical protein [Bacillus solitudinis]|uniref:hypothetical protein n=1 Tax=Bacillus solitudinis TaxID=2014074 RepID=UPI000C236A0C|nr:hypothetical protein [Bacillus solitudinis]